MTNNSWQVIDTDLTPANIKSGVNIFGVDGILDSWFAGQNVNLFNLKSDWKPYFWLFTDNDAQPYWPPDDRDAFEKEAIYDDWINIWFLWLTSSYDNFQRNTNCVFVLSKMNKSTKVVINYSDTRASLWGDSTDVSVNWAVDWTKFYLALRPDWTYYPYWERLEFDTVAETFTYKNNFWEPAGTVVWNTAIVFNGDNIRTKIISSLYGRTYFTTINDSLITTLLYIEKV